MKSRNALRTVVGLNLAQAVARTAFAIIGLTSGLQQFADVPISTIDSAIMEIGFLGLGIAGAISVLGYASERDWTVKSIVAVNVATVAFDIWGLTIQPSAAIGFIVPILTLGYFLVMRHKNVKELSSAA